MKIKSIKIIDNKKSKNVLDCFVDNGYRKLHHGSLPDIDTDFDSTKRDDVKAYLERRYNHDGKQRVFSAGTFTTLQVKSVIKDVCRVHRVSVNMANYITAIIDDNAGDWTELMLLAAKEKKVRDFIQKHPDVFEEIRPIMFQPRSEGIHASAVVVTPDIIKGEDVECFDIIPIKKMNGLLVSELSGTELDELGLLKNDLLGIAELSRLDTMIQICNKEYGTNLSIESIATSALDEPKVYEIIRKGLTQGIFQLSSDGMTRYIKSMHPESINDIIAANALFRPATLDSGAAKMYVDAKEGVVDPEYLWGTYDILKDTYAVAAYQEQYAALARKIGGLSLGDGVNLVKAISKKKIDKIRKFKDKFYSGASKNGCPDEVRDRVWGIIEGGATYGFNKCIAGDEHIMRSDRNTRLTIEEMYKTMNDREWAKRNGHISLYDKYQREGYGNGMSILEDGRIHENKIIDITYSGVRPVYLITLDNGKTIQLTANHKCPTNRGELLVAEMVVGEDQMYVCGEYQKDDTMYRFTDKGKMNNPRYHNDDWTVPYKINSEKGHCGFTKRKTAFTRLEDYRENHMKDHCELCGKKGGRLEIHHKNGDHSFVGNRFENLITVCQSCHKKEHYKMGRVKRGQKGYPVELHTIVSIKHIGEKPVYDIEMADPCHNFANSNGIVVCNSHATAYGITAYIGAYIKALYPVAFYTVLLKWGKDAKMTSILQEIRELNNITITQPDINVSGDDFVSNYKTNEIYWSILRIKQVGLKAVDFIVAERNRHGEFTSLEDFIKRIFRNKFKKYKDWDDIDNDDEFRKCPVTALTVKNLILAGAFDKLMNVGSITERYGLMAQAAELLGFKIDEKLIPEDLRDKHWFWGQKQIALTGFGAIDYERIYRNATKPTSLNSVRYFRLEDLQEPGNDKLRVAICATILECTEHKYKDKSTGETKHCGKVTLQQNIDTGQLTIWNDAWIGAKDYFWQKKDRIVIFQGVIKWSDYDEQNVLQINKGAFVMNI